MCTPRLPVLALLVLLLGGCGATVVGENKQGIWFREPFVGGWDMQEQADRHCSQFGKTAVSAGTFDPTPFALPIVSFDCE